MIDAADTRVALKSGQPVVCPLGPGFALDGEATLVFNFKPGWAMPPHAKSGYGPFILRCGSEADPASVFGIRVSEDARSLLIGSEHTKMTALGAIPEAHVPIRIVISDGTASFFRRGAEDLEKVSIELGSIPAGLTARLTLGGADDDGAYPFEGLVGGIMLFDKDISAVLPQTGPANPLLRDWLNNNPPAFLAAFNDPAQHAVASALYGVALPGRGEFDVIPREMLWPPTTPTRWMLAGGNQPPEPVIVQTIDDQSRQGIYTTNHVYCFTRVQNVPCLWSDSGYRFRIAYAGRNQFAGSLLPDGAKAISLEYRPGQLGHKDTVAITPVGGWSNTQEKIFVTTPYPEGTELRELAGAGDLDGVERLIWPEAPVLTRLAPTYNEENNDAGAPVQPWSDAFAAKPNLFVYSMCGWDLTKLSNPFDPIQSGAADRDEGYFLFEPPKGLEYRGNGNLPYYVFRHNLVSGSHSSDQHVYRSMREFSSEFSNSVGIGFGKGDVNFFDASFSSEIGQGQAVTVEHSVAVDYGLNLAFAGLLEKQWMTLNPRFITDILDAIGSSYLTVPAQGADPTPPSILTAQQNGAPAARAALHGVFRNWGTHYANAITYGTSTFSIGLIDDVALMEMSKSQTKTDVSLDVPLEGFMVKLKSAQQTGEMHKVETGNHSEIYRSITAGEPQSEVPLLLDLRPIWELLQPPYIYNPRVASAVPYADDILQALPEVKAAWSEYIDLFKRSPPDGSILYDARLVSLANSSRNPCYVNTRADIGATTDGTGWGTDRPHTRIDFWPATTLRVNPGQSATPASPGFARLTMPASLMEGVMPTLFWTGFITEVDLNTIRQDLTEWRQGPSIGGIEVPPMPIEPSDEQVNAQADVDGHHYEINLDQFGPAPAVSGDPWGSRPERLDMMTGLGGLPPDGTLTTIPLTAGPVTATYECRMLDIRACWEQLRAKGGTAAS